MIAGQSPYPERASGLHLARSSSQSRREIRFILPAHGARHIIIDVISPPWDQEFTVKLGNCISHKQIYKITFGNERFTVNYLCIDTYILDSF